MPQVFTRDTFGAAIKSTYAEFKNNNSLIKTPIFKDPKTDKEDGGESMKKSHKGCCKVFWRDKLSKKITYEDGFTYDDSMNNTLMEVIFKDGKLIKEQTLTDIRNRLNNYNF